MCFGDGTAEILDGLVKSLGSLAHVNVTRPVLALALFFCGSAQWAITADCFVLVLAHCVERGQFFVENVRLDHAAGLFVFGSFGEARYDELDSGIRPEDE